jgi:hypothetical protein
MHLVCIDYWLSVIEGYISCLKITARNSFHGIWYCHINHIWLSVQVSILVVRYLFSGIYFRCIYFQVVCSGIYFQVSSGIYCLFRYLFSIRYWVSIFKILLELDRMWYASLARTPVDVESNVRRATLNLKFFFVISSNTELTGCSWWLFRSEFGAFMVYRSLWRVEKGEF